MCENVYKEEVGSILTVNDRSIVVLTSCKIEDEIEKANNKRYNSKANSKTTDETKKINQSKKKDINISRDTTSADIIEIKDDKKTSIEEKPIIIETVINSVNGNKIENKVDFAMLDSKNSKDNI